MSVHTIRGTPETPVNLRQIFRRRSQRRHPRPARRYRCSPVSASYRVDGIGDEEQAHADLDVLSDRCMRAVSRSHRDADKPCGNDERQYALPFDRMPDPRQRLQLRRGASRRSPGKRQPAAGARDPQAHGRDTGANSVRPLRQVPASAPRRTRTICSVPMARPRSLAGWGPARTHDSICLGVSQMPSPFAVGSIMAFARLTIHENYFFLSVLQSPNCLVSPRKKREGNSDRTLAPHGLQACSYLLSPPESRAQRPLGSTTVAPSLAR